MDAGALNEHPYKGNLWISGVVSLVPNPIRRLPIIYDVVDNWDTYGIH